MYELLKLFYREGVVFYFMLLIGLMFLGSFIMIFFEVDFQTKTLWEKIVDGNYWSIVTIATLGYGDLAPKSPFGRILTIAFLFLAIAVVALFSANVTSALTARKIKEARGLNTATSLKNHLVILGWKRDMHEMLTELLEASGLHCNDVVLVCNVSAEQAESFLSAPDLSGLRLIRGPHHAEETLALSNPAAAASILLLADESMPGGSDTETDSRTVMAAMVLAKYVRRGHVVAEILDPSYARYLENTKVVDEIVFSRRVGRDVLKMSVSNLGVVNTLDALLGGWSGARLTTFRVPAAYVGHTVRELRELVASQMDGAMLLGLVENVGKTYERKSEALREAQRTPDMEKLVANLLRVKQLEANQPRINPSSSYIIQPNSLAVVIPAEEQEGST